MKNRKQITDRGIAQRSGLDVFSNITIYTGDYVNFGNGIDLSSSLSTATDHATTAANPTTDALANNPASDIGKWYRYHTSGSPWTSVSAPTSASGYILFYGQVTGGLTSMSGMYQKLSLIKGDEYQVSIRTAVNTNTGTLYVNIYSPQLDGSFSASIIDRIDFPVTIGATSIQTSTFTASNANDIIVLYFITSETSSQTVAITDISVKQKEEYLVPMYATDQYGNDHKILRRSTNEKISND
tara:strand:- start:429 stop:1151 length:723 start_codon:yes stop_codon:yes gene_type:complete